MFKVPVKSNNGQTDTKILLGAMSKDKVHLAKFITDALDGAIIDSKTGDFQTPLISSVLLPDWQSRCKLTELLILKGASVNCRDERGRTALSYACEQGYLDAVKILVRNNADPEMVDPWGNTPLMYAAVAGHSPVVEFLVRAFKRLGLQIGRQNNVGNSAVAVAKFLGHTSCVFALTSKPKTVGRLTDIPDCAADEENSKQRLDPLIRRDETTQTGPLTLNHRSSALDRSWLSRTTGISKKSLIINSCLQSMDSIEEFARENDSSPSSPQDHQFFSGVLTPKPPPQAKNGHTVCNSATPGEKWASAGHLPPLSRGCNPLYRGCEGHAIALLYSPRPGKNISKPPTSSPLCILLTPIINITAKKVGKDESETERLKPSLDLGARRFDESYYDKRCSLPTSVLSPLPPDRSLRKTKTICRDRRHPRDPQLLPTVNNTEHSETTVPPPVTTSSTTFSTLSNRLRRFTFPEFRKSWRGSVEKGVRGGYPNSGSAGGIPHSETFPVNARRQHPQAGSKSSIDSISAVKCEFEKVSRSETSHSARHA